jgi:hypothetical protein
MINLSGTDFFLSMVELESISPQLAIDWPISGGGDASSQCEFILSQYDITCDPVDAIAYLLPYGAWEQEDLTDHDENMLKLVWLIGTDLGESGEAYLSGY